MRSLYEDRLDGTITRDHYEEKQRILQAQLTQAQQTLLQTKDHQFPPLTTSVDILRRTSNAAQAAREQNETRQRQFLTTTLKIATWKDRALTAVLLEPFELLRRSNQHNTDKMSNNGGTNEDFEKWLPRNAVFKLALQP